MAAAGGMENGNVVLVTGGAGYVGSALVPNLLDAGHRVRVLDLYLFGDRALAAVRDHTGLEEVKGDIRDAAALERALAGTVSVIHLAAISNDPSFELDPELARSINYDAFIRLVDMARDAGVRRFVYASSASVYGIKEDREVTEDLPLAPITDYAKYKALCEEELEKRRRPGFATLTIRPASVCGYAPRQRLDLTVNILTHHAVSKGRIRVFGGAQMRPNIHIEDMTDIYEKALSWPEEKIDGRVFNAGCENLRVAEIAERVRAAVGPQVDIETTGTADLRSYHISSEKIARELGFRPKRTIDEAATGLAAALADGLVPRAATDSRYYNLKRMKEVKLR